MSARVLQVIGGSQFGGAVWVVRDYVEALQEHGCTVAVCASVESVSEVFERAGCEIVSIDEMRREIDPRRDILALATLARICRDRRFDVVHTHTSKGGFLGRAAARIAGVPVVIHTAHGFAFHESSSRLSTAVYTRLERLAARWSDRVTTVSEFHREWAIEQRLASPEKIVAIQNGISRSRIVVARERSDVRRELSLDESDVLLVSTGRLARQKGLETLLLAMPEILRRDDRVRLALVGDGPSRPDLEAQARTAGLESEVRFLGFRTDVGDILNAADLVVAPSRWEGLSISVLEAMAMGKPIVTTNIGSNLELVEDAVSGLLVPPDDPAALAEAVLRLAANPDVASQYGDEAKERYERAFTERAMKESVWKLYDEVLREKHVTGSAVAATLGEPPVDDVSPATTAVRPMRLGDVPVVVDVHLRAFPGFFLTFLGPRFLALFYRSAVELGEVAVVSAVGDRVTGFAMGSAAPGRFFRKLLRGHVFAFPVAALPAVARRPATALRVARALRKPSEAAKPAGTATLLSIAVDPAVQARGQGRLLVEAFLRECGARGAVSVDLTTDRFGNDAVNAFYTSVGFRVGREITTPEGRVLNEYVLDLAPDEATGTRPGAVAGRGG